MTRRPGDLRLELMGDLLRNPASDLPSIRGRIAVSDPQVLRVTLRRMNEAGFVHAMQGGRFMLSAKGRAYIEQVLAWVGSPKGQGRVGREA